jgi:hypothetical protein
VIDECSKFRDSLAFEELPTERDLESDPFAIAWRLAAPQLPSFVSSFARKGELSLFRPECEKRIAIRAMRMRLE